MNKASLCSQRWLHAYLPLKFLCLVHLLVIEPWPSWLVHPLLIEETMLDRDSSLFLAFKSLFGVVAIKIRNRINRPRSSKNLIGTIEIRHHVGVAIGCQITTSLPIGEIVPSMLVMPAFWIVLDDAVSRATH